MHVIAFGDANDTTHHPAAFFPSSTIGAAVVDRGAASAVYFSLYYGAGALGGYVPGLAWQAWHWDGVAAIGLTAASLAGVSLLSSRGRASVRPRASHRARSASA